jgi:hypothetical protein
MTPFASTRASTQPKYQQLLSAAAGADLASDVSTATLPPLSSELAVRELLGLTYADATAA